MLAKQLGLVLAIIVTSMGFTSTASANHPQVNTGQVTIFRTLHTQLTNPIPPGASRTFNRQCASNEQVVAGGVETQEISGNLAMGFKIVHSYPVSQRRWTFRLYNSDDLGRGVRLYIVCAS